MPEPHAYVRTFRTFRTIHAPRTDLGIWVRDRAVSIADLVIRIRDRAILIPDRTGQNAYTCAHIAWLNTSARTRARAQRNTHACIRYVPEEWKRRGGGEEVHNIALATALSNLLMDNTLKHPPDIRA